MAGVLAMNPDVLVFDEPTSALDPDSARSIMDLLDELHHAGKSIIISTHDVELAYTWADRIVLMNEGRIILCTKPTDAFSDKEVLAEAKLSKPVLVEPNDALRELGMAQSEKIPRSVLDIVGMLAMEHHCCCDRRAPGFIVLADAGSLNEMLPERIARDEAITIIGGMGSAAKKQAHNCKISLTYTHGVIDKCLLKAISGHNSLIITSGGMLQRVLSRVEEFNDESGNRIEIVTLENYLRNNRPE